MFPLAIGPRVAPPLSAVPSSRRDSTHLRKVVLDPEEAVYSLVLPMVRRPRPSITLRTFIMPPSQATAPLTIM